MAQRIAMLFDAHTQTQIDRERHKSLHHTDITRRPESCEEGEDGDERVNEARMEAQQKTHARPVCLMLIIQNRISETSVFLSVCCPLAPQPRSLASHATVAPILSLSSIALDCNIYANDHLSCVLLPV